MSVVREELGPSLPQLLKPHWLRLAPRMRVALVAAVVGGIVLLVAAYEVLRSDPLEVIVVKEPVAFNLIHRADFPKVTPKGDEILRLEGDLPLKKKPEDGLGNPHETFAVEPLKVAPFKGDISAAYLTLATKRLEALRAADPNVRYRGEGKARINLNPGYQLSYQTRSARGRLVFGKVFWLAPEPADGEEQSRDGAILSLTAEFSGQVPNATALGSDTLLKGPLRSFRFGTERP